MLLIMVCHGLCAEMNTADLLNRVAWTWSNLLVMASIMLHSTDALLLCSGEQEKNLHPTCCFV